MKRCFLPLLLVLASACDDAELGGPAPERELRFSALSSGPQHTCGIAEGKAYCWGAGEFGELGRSDPADSQVPREVELDEPLVQISAGFSHTCALALSGDAYCWGWNVRGQLGINSLGSSPTPVLVSGDHRFIAITSGWNHTCGIAEGARVYCWGANGQGQLGNGARQDALLPLPVLGDVSFAQVSAGAFHTCGVSADSLAYCWGLNNTGQLGTGTVADSARPVLVETGHKFVQVDAGHSHTCGIAAGGKPFCWGSNVHGELGNRGFERPGVPGSMTPHPVLSDFLFGSINAGTDFSCAVTIDGVGYCWGKGIDGQLGTGLLRDEAVPLFVAPPSGPNAPDHQPFLWIGADGLTHACGLTAANSVFCWGRGRKGQLGHPSILFSSLPLRVPGAP